MRSFLHKLAFYPTSAMLRWQIASARRLLRGRFRWYALDSLSIPGHGTDLLRLDFPPPSGTPPRWGHGRPPHALIAEILSAGEGAQLALLESCLAWADACAQWPQDEDPRDAALPWRRNLFLTPLEQTLLFGMLRQSRPERYVEIGSGMSTRVAWQARRAGALPMEIVSIDPEPRLAIAALCDAVHRCRLEEMADRVLELVTPKTVIFFDGSHRAFAGGDVPVFFLELLPRLPVGTIVHIHDIHLPSDYPSDVASRFWSEQYLLAAYLLGGSARVKVTLPLAHLLRRATARRLVEDALGEPAAHGSSFWLEMT